MRILLLFALSCCLLSCNNRNYFGASNYTLEWQDFNQPSTIENDFEVAITPKLYYEGGGKTPSGIVKELYGGYVGSSAVVSEQIVLGLGGGYRFGNVQTNPDDNNERTIERYATNNLQANAQLGFRAKNMYNDFYPVLINFNYGKDGGDYLDFRNRLLETNSIRGIDVEDLFSWQIGSKVFTEINDVSSASLYGGILFKDKSTTTNFERGTNSLLASLAYYYDDFTFDARATIGFYGGIGFGAGYRFE